MKTFLGCIVGFYILVSQAHGGLVQWDAFNSGDELAVKDESTGLVWLDLSQTIGIHYEDVSGLYDGWELASFSDVENLLDSVFQDIQFVGNFGFDNKFEEGCMGDTDCFSSASQWQALFGAVAGVHSSITYSFGLYMDASEVLRMGGAFIGEGNTANRYGSDYIADHSAYYDYRYNILREFDLYSTFLVKTDSIPQSVDAPNVSLLIISIVGLLIFFRRSDFVKVNCR